MPAPRHIGIARALLTRNALAPSTLLNNLVAYWPLDEASGAATRYDVIGTSHLTQQGTVGAAAGHTDNGATFDANIANYLTCNSSSVLQLNGTDATVCCWGKVSVENGFPSFMGKWAVSGSNSGYQLSYDATLHRFYGGVSNNGTTFKLVYANTFGAPTLGTFYFLTLRYRLSDGLITFGADGVYNTDTLTGGIFADTASFRIGRSDVATKVLNGAVDEAAIFKRRLSDDELLYVRTNGLYTRYTLQDADFWDNERNTSRSGYTERTALARVKLLTDATRIEAVTYSNIVTDSPAVAKIGVRMNSADVNSVTATVNAANNNLGLDISGGGVRTVEVISGAQNKPSTTVLGSYLSVIRAWAATTFTIVAPNPTSRMLIYGDSIATGYTATKPPLEAWSVLLRRHIDSVTALAWGGRALYDDGVDGTARQALVDAIVVLNPARIWLAVGTNDYGLNKWSAANFGTAYADLLDKLHAALPTTPIYAQSPILRSSEGANTFGDSLSAYRTQISTACSTRVWATYVNGATILTTGDLADGIHPTTAGHALYYASVKATLGL